MHGYSAGKFKKALNPHRVGGEVVSKLIGNKCLLEKGGTTTTDRGVAESTIRVWRYINARSSMLECGGEKYSDRICLVGDWLRVGGVGVRYPKWRCV